MKVMTLIGCGLIGGSFALASKKAGVFQRVIACDRNPESLQKALALGVADSISDNVTEAVREADCIVVATPVLAMGSVFSAVRQGMRKDAVVTDVGSTRMAVRSAAESGLGEYIGRYAPCHPIAGGEMPGVEYAKGDLFTGKAVISTPSEGADADAVEFAENAWRAVGGNVQRMTAELHDEVFASVSHLPHLLSYALVDMIANEDLAKIKFSLAGAGFRDFTRIASSSPEMWRDICITNQAALSRELKLYRKHLEELQAALDQKDAKALEACFDNASRHRRSLVFPK